MLIVSKHHDYYDSTLKTGIDKTIVFKREESDRIQVPFGFSEKEFAVNEEHKFIQKLFVKYLCIKSKYGTFDVNHFGLSNRYYNRAAIRGKAGMIVFCNKIYLFAELVTQNNYGLDTSNFIFNEKQLNDFIVTNKNNIEKYNSASREGFDYCASFIKKFLLDSGKEDEIVLPYCRDNKVVYFSIQGDRDYYRRIILIKHPRLKELFGFQHVVDPFTAAQEIMMFVGGVIPNSGNEMVAISDKSMIKKHGFDDKSFRKEPTKKVNKK